MVERIWNRLCMGEAFYISTLSMILQDFYFTVRVSFFRIYTSIMHGLLYTI